MLTIALLMATPIVAADGGNDPTDILPPEVGSLLYHCPVFYYEIDPVGYHLDPDCLL